MTPTHTPMTPTHTPAHTPPRRHAPRATAPRAARLAALALIPLLAPAARAGYAQPGHGLQTVATGSVVNGALYWQTEPAWVNLTPPAMPCLVRLPFTLPPCLEIPAARLALTVWGGSANHLCQLHAAVNGAPLTAPGGLVFGTTADATPVFDPAVPCAYGSGSGVWLVTLPVAGGRLRTDGGTNEVVVTLDTPDSFDGRVQHVTLIAVYRSAWLANSLDYAIAEGSGDIYRSPASGQADRRTVALGTAGPGGATAAALTALYTYGDTGQHDRLLFNGAPLGDADVAGWDKGGSGRDYGPSVVAFDVLPHLVDGGNQATFTVAAGEVPDARESSLRPQLAALAVTRATATPAARPILHAGRTATGLTLTLFAPLDQPCQLMESEDLADWVESVGFVSAGAPVTLALACEPGSRFFRAQSP